MKNYFLLMLLLPVFVIAEENLATLRNGDITIETDSPRMSKVENKDVKRKRNYPMQPPTIPHKINSYHIDLNSNKCLSCHSRRRIEESKAPMVSVTHYMDRDGNFLAEVSPRRYFCNQCHVPQIERKPLVENIFQDVDSLIQKKKTD
ncbi:MAG: nitrate reductase cytochrome c-type subunit [Gammaproteobacteria bacterium]|jgi:cytochrome c-type protein NapB|nr:nitrate reductase cytochrome c-type subunit [Gammaproteobacteria bacterium]